MQPPSMYSASTFMILPPKILCHSCTSYLILGITVFQLFCYLLHLNLTLVNNNSQNIVSLKSELVKIIKESLSDQDKSFETYKLERSNLDNLTVAKKSAGENDIFTFKQQSIIKESSEKILYFIKNASYSDDEKVQGMVKEMTREFRRLDIRSLAGLEIVRGTYQKIIDELYVEGRLDERLNLNLDYSTI